MSSCKSVANGFYQNLLALGIPLVRLDDSQQVECLHYSGDADSFVELIKNIEPGAVFYQTITNADMLSWVGDCGTDDLESISCFFVIDGVKLGFVHVSDDLESIVQKLEDETKSQLEAKALDDSRRDEINSELFECYKDDDRFHKIKADKGRMLYIEDKSPNHVDELRSLHFANPMRSDYEELALWDCLTPLVKELRAYRQAQNALKA